MDWKVMIGEKEHAVPDAGTLRAWFEEKRIQPNTHVFHPDKRKWMCLRDVEELAELVPANETLIDKYREDYSRALLAIDHDVADLIHQGKEMQALMVLNQTAGDSYTHAPEPECRSVRCAHENNGVEGRRAHSARYPGRTPTSSESASVRGSPFDTYSTSASAS